MQHHFTCATETLPVRTRFSLSVCLQQKVDLVIGTSFGYGICSYKFCTYNIRLTDPKHRASMPNIRISQEEFLKDLQGRTFADVVNDPEQPFKRVLQFFNQADNQRRMEESELHHDRSPLAGVVRELESLPEIDRFLAAAEIKRNNRFRQMIGVLVRMIMERRGWQKTGRKGSLGVRASGTARTPAHNTGGLAFWFLRAERYELKEGMPFRSVRQRCSELESARPKKKKKKKSRARQ